MSSHTTANGRYAAKARKGYPGLSGPKAMPSTTDAKFRAPKTANCSSIVRTDRFATVIVTETMTIRQ